MQLTQLADDIVSLINSAPEETWSGYTAGTTESDDFKASPALDPVNDSESQIAGLYVIPMITGYNIDASPGRQQIVKLNKTPVISICLSFPFSESDESRIDVSSWSEVKKIINFREEIEKLVLSRQWDYDIIGVEPMPPMEIEMKNKWFLVATEITWSGFSC